MRRSKNIELAPLSDDIDTNKQDIRSAPASQQVRPRAAAAYLGVSAATLWRWHARRDDFPRGRKLSAAVTVFDLGELRAWRDAQPCSPRSGQ